MHFLQAEKSKIPLGRLEVTWTPCVQVATLPARFIKLHDWDTECDFAARNLQEKGISIAIVDSGIDPTDERVRNADIEGWSIRLGATGHALLSPDFADENGHGTKSRRRFIGEPPKLSSLR